MTTIDSRERDARQLGRAGRLAVLGIGRRREIEAVGLLVGILGTLVVIVMTIGSGSPFGP